MNVIRLATLLKFDGVCRVAVREVNHMNDPTLKLAIARQHDVKEFLTGALRLLVDREQALEVADYETLGLELAANVVKYRERCRQVREVESDTILKDEDVRRKILKDTFGSQFSRDVLVGERLIRPRTAPPQAGIAPRVCL